jgi:signal transduction histidine kinase
VITSVAKDNPALSGTLDDRKSSILVVLTLWQLGFTALIFVICIFFSHKVAGPLYKLKKFLIQVKEGQNISRLSFRKGDYFQDIADEFNSAIEKLQNEHKNDFVYLSEVNTYLNNLSLVVPEDKKVVLREIRKKLDEIQERFAE